MAVVPEPMSKKWLFWLSIYTLAKHVKLFFKSIKSRRCLKKQKMFSNQNHYANSHSILFLTVTKEKTYAVKSFTHFCNIQLNFSPSKFHWNMTGDRSSENLLNRLFLVPRLCCSALANALNITFCMRFCNLVLEWIDCK